MADEDKIQIDGVPISACGRGVLIREIARLRAGEAKWKRATCAKCGLPIKGSCLFCGDWGDL